MFWHCGLEGVIWPWRDVDLDDDDVGHAKAKLSGLGRRCRFPLLSLVDYD